MNKGFFKKILTKTFDELKNRDFSEIKKANKSLSRNHGTTSFTNPNSLRYNGLTHTQKDRTGLGKSKNDRVKISETKSSAIKELSYDNKTGDTFVKFTSGKKTYRYPAVPKDKIIAWLRAPSKGRAFSELIKPYSINA